MISKSILRIVGSKSTNALTQAGIPNPSSSSRTPSPLETRSSGSCSRGSCSSRYDHGQLQQHQPYKHMILQEVSLSQEVIFGGTSLLYIQEPCNNRNTNSDDNTSAHPPLSAPSPRRHFLCSSAPRRRPRRGISIGSPHSCPSIIRS